MAGNADPVDVDVHLHFVTQKAYLVSLDNKDDSGIWVPRSHCDIRKTYPNKLFNNLHTLTLPEWLALDKGLI